jgi:hypothetical protein
VNRIGPPALHPEIFDLTMKGLEAGLKVGDIATYGFAACDAGDESAEVLGRPELVLFDCIPVRQGDRVVGVLEREGGVASGRVCERMRALDESLLVSAAEPLKGFIPLLVAGPHRLVVRGARIEGIVTSSDVHKLPVRLLVFALVTHLELTMSDAILRTFEGDEWLDLLQPSRRQKVIDKFAKLRTQNFDPPLLEVTDFCDKRDVLGRKGLLQPKGRAIDEFKRIEALRNSVAHAATYVHSQEQFAEFVALMELTESWIRRLATWDASDAATAVAAEE